MTLVVLAKLYWIRNRAVNAWMPGDPHLLENHSVVGQNSQYRNAIASGPLRPSLDRVAKQTRRYLDVPGY